MLKRYSQYFCETCFEDGKQGDIFFERNLTLRSVIINNKRFLLLLQTDADSKIEIYLKTSKLLQFFSNSSDPFYLCSYFQLTCPSCSTFLGFILKATTEQYSLFREKVLLFSSLIHICDLQNDTLPNDNVQNSLQKTMDHLNLSLEQYQDLIERQSMVEQGITNVAKIIAKINKKYGI